VVSASAAVESSMHRLRRRAIHFFIVNNPFLIGLYALVRRGRMVRSAKTLKLLLHMFYIFARRIHWKDRMLHSIHGFITFDHACKGGVHPMEVLVEKSKRQLTLFEGDAPLFRCTVALGRCPEGAKTEEGDGRTPEGSYYICLIKEKGKYGRSLGISYPSPEDGEKALLEGRIDEKTQQNICAAWEKGQRPPRGSPLGGEIYLHEGGSHSDWTEGCIALNEADMAHLFSFRDQIARITILP
jgi:hypothetical protein